MLEVTAMTALFYGLAAGAVISVVAASGWILVAFALVFEYLQVRKVRPLELQNMLIRERLRALHSAVAADEQVTRKRSREHADDGRPRLCLAPRMEDVSSSRANTLPTVDFAAELNDDSNEGCIVHTTG
jgi:hypothetical protein